MRRVAVALALCVLIASNLWGSEVPAAQEKHPSVALVVAGKVNKAGVEAVQLHLSRRLFVVVHVEKVKIAAGISADQAISQIKATMKAGDLCAVCLGGDGCPWPRLSLVEEKQVAMIGVSALKPPAGEKLDHTWMRRVRKESVRAVCLMLGLKDCAFPRCALLNTVNDTQLDDKGDTPCPPCYKSLQKIMKERGLKPIYR